MTPVSFPTVFISHGAPTLPRERGVPAREFLAGLGARYPNVSAVLCVSAHWNTPRPAVNAVVHPSTIHDFSGFPGELYGITYPAPGDTDLAGRVAALVEAAGLPCDIDTGRGLDHGAWVPLMLMYPKATIPAVQLSIQGHLDPSRHFILGDAIARLRHEGVLVIGSGGAVHPLGDPAVALGDGLPTDAWAVGFNEWLNHAVTTGDRSGLIRYRELAPAAVHAHPYPDHFMPLLVAMGAAGPVQRVRSSTRAGTGEIWAWVRLNSSNSGIFLKFFTLSGKTGNPKWWHTNYTGRVSISFRKAGKSQYFLRD
jgi:4,5-DOPA dioxygenase extradiol